MNENTKNANLVCRTMDVAMKRTALALITLVSVSISLPLSAAVVVAVGSGEINGGGIWGGSAPTSGNDYVLQAPGSGYGAVWGTGTFGGDSLTVNANTLYLNQNGTYTINDLRTATGTLVVLDSFSAVVGNTLDGNWTVQGTTDIRALSASADEAYTIDSDLYGRGAMRFGSGSDFQNDVTFGSSSASAWVGTIAMTQTGDQKMILDFSNDHDLNRPTMGNLFIGTGTLNAPTSQLNLDQNFTFQNAQLTYAGGSVTLEKGYYKYADLLAIDVGPGVTAADFFVDGGDFGLNIVAIPEPTALGLLAMGAIILRLRFRKLNVNRG